MHDDHYACLHLSTCFKHIVIVTVNKFSAYNAYSSTNGVKEMEGFREFFNLSRIEGNNTCRANDDRETNLVLVN